MMPQDSRWRITAQFGRNQTTITASNQPLADTETADSKQTKTTEDDDKVVGQNADGQNANLMAWLSSSDCKNDNIMIPMAEVQPHMTSHSQPLQNHILGKHVDCFSGLVWKQKRREKRTTSDHEIAVAAASYLTFLILENNPGRNDWQVGNVSYCI